MDYTIISPTYAKIARDLAGRILNEEFTEGQRIYGRSTMASEYNTSPETIRRAFRLLSDMKVVEVKPQSGVIVLSKDSAKRFIGNFKDSNGTVALARQLYELKTQYDLLNKTMLATVDALAQSKCSFSAAAEALPNYEIRVPENSKLIGRSIGSLQFWQSTEATIIAIRRCQNVILSPGPYAELYGGDVIILVGTPPTIEAAQSYILEGGKE